MPNATHVYPARVSWAGGREGGGSVDFNRSGETFSLAVPPEFGGEGGATNPEELLTGAVAACYSITFGIVAANRKLPVISVSTEATGEVDQVGASMTFKKITIRPNISLSGDATDDQVALVREMALKADQYCIVTNAVRAKVEIKIDPVISVPIE